MFKEGDLVIMLTKYLCVKYRSYKLVDKYLGPFYVIEIVSYYGLAY